MHRILLIKNKENDFDACRFGTIMEKQHDKHMEKYGWVEAKAGEAAVMLIEATKKDTETGM
jgi:hypothetical protein